ncbi:MAG: alpha/beta hydrolase [Planctomycetes bacterium]|nr:alpha/beta hydrolase [Planctomycetota bacterium]
MAHDTAFLLLPGMAAEERLFASQMLAFPNLRVPRWIAPLPNESLRAYAARLASVVDPGRPCIVGGASFGGIVALEMSLHLRTVACVLIGSVRSPAEFSWRWRLLRPLVYLGPDQIGWLAGLLVWVGKRWLPRGTARRLERLSRPEAAFVRWALCAVLRWQPSPTVKHVRVFHIHGEADRTLPVELTRPDEVVPGGSHALSLFNAGEVNVFLRRVLAWAACN